VVDDVVAARVELGVVVAFGQLLPPALLAAAPLGFVNVHFSLLPRWRGAAPVERAILAGDAETGVCVMGLEAGLDTGPVYARRSTPIGSDETAGELRARLVALGTDLLVDTVPRVPGATPEPQAGEPTYADKLTVDEFALDWHRPAAQLARVVRAGNPRPGAFTFDGGTRLKIWRARPVATTGRDGAGTVGTVGPDAGVQTGDGALLLLEVQPEGRRAMPAGAWLSGRRADAPLGSVAGA
jgi:methionyl-tRNA formyltransferase